MFCMRREREGIVKRDEGNLDVVYDLLLSSTPPAAIFGSHLTLANCFVEHGQGVGCWVYIFSVRWGSLSHGRIRYDGSTAHAARSTISFDQAQPVHTLGGLDPQSM
jgi:hypothetical protein